MSGSGDVVVAHAPHVPNASHDLNMRQLLRGLQVRIRQQLQVFAFSLMIENLSWPNGSVDVALVSRPRITFTSCWASTTNWLSRHLHHNNRLNLSNT